MGCFHAYIGQDLNVRHCASTGWWFQLTRDTSNVQRPRCIAPRKSSHQETVVPPVPTRSCYFGSTGVSNNVWGIMAIHWSWNEIKTIVFIQCSHFLYCQPILDKIKNRSWYAWTLFITFHNSSRVTYFFDRNFLEESMLPYFAAHNSPTFSIKIAGFPMYHQKPRVLIAKVAETTLQRVDLEVQK